ncbi:polysaccharide biosynthesis protein, partial [Burkholderia sp. Cy-647]|uniref:hypothetical protein n=1 Tax=Burkholderia sp. Cy-647 TaxID=2608328 RepID=UPI0019663601
ALLGAGYLAGSRHRGGGDSLAAAAAPSAGGAPARAPGGRRADRARAKTVQPAQPIPRTTI